MSLIDRVGVLSNVRCRVHRSIVGGRVFILYSDNVVCAAPAAVKFPLKPLPDCRSVSFHHETQQQSTCQYFVPCFPA